MNRRAFAGLVGWQVGKGAHARYTTLRFICETDMSAKRGMTVPVLGIHCFQRHGREGDGTVGLRKATSTVTRYTTNYETLSGACLKSFVLLEALVVRMLTQMPADSTDERF